MWGELSRISQGKKDAMTISATGIQEHEDNEIFLEKARKFDEVEDAFRSLLHALTTYKAAIAHATECSVEVATRLDKFFIPSNPEQKELASKFIASQQSILDKWLGESEKIFDSDVLTPIKNKVDEIPTVREVIKRRADLRVEMQKRQKKLQSERKKEGTRYREKQRKLKEISSHYAMYHDQVIERFNYIDRNMANFVTSPLRSLVTVMSDVSQSSTESLSDIVQTVARAPLITRDLSPAPPTSLTQLAGGIVDQEQWDNSYAFGDDDDDDIEGDFDNADTDSANANASARRPPRGRVRSADAVGKGPSSAMDSSSALDVPSSSSPRRGRSASSAPADVTAIYSPTLSHPLGLSVVGQRETSKGPGSASLRTSQHAQDNIFLNSVGTSAGSSTSTENVTNDNNARGGSSHLDSFQLDSFQRRRRRDGRGSGDTIGSGENPTRGEVVARLVAKFNFVPQERNELELRAGDIIEVTERTTNGWWLGRSGHSCGYFPHNYTRELTVQEEQKYLTYRYRKERSGHRRQDSRESRASAPTTPRPISGT